MYIIFNDSDEDDGENQKNGPEALLERFHRAESRRFASPTLKSTLEFMMATFIQMSDFFHDYSVFDCHFCCLIALV